MDTQRELDEAMARLARRSPKALAEFVGSLAHDGGPIGEQVRTFVVADNLAACVASIAVRIEALRERRPRYDRHQDGAQVGERFGYIVEAIETWVVPVDPGAACALLVALVERDGDAMEQCGDHFDTVERALDRAAGLLAVLAPALADRDFKRSMRRDLERLVAEDAYGTRSATAGVASALKATSEEG